MHIAITHRIEMGTVNRVMVTVLGRFEIRALRCIIVHLAFDKLQSSSS